MLKAASIYFGVVFGAGFVLGTVRVLLIVPMIGVRGAELSESPLMLITTIVAAEWVRRKFCRSLAELQLLGVGSIAVGLILAADIIVGVGLRGMSLVQVFTERDSVSGPVYYGLLGLFALMPWLLGRQHSSHIAVHFGNSLQDHQAEVAPAWGSADVRRSVTASAPLATTAGPSNPGLMESGL